MYQLTPFTLFNPEYEMPNVVIFDIALIAKQTFDPHLVENYEDRLEVINRLVRVSYPKIRDTNDLTSQELEAVVSFINRKEKWKKKPLLQAYNLFRQYEEAVLQDDLTVFSSRAEPFTPGIQTMTRIDSVNSLILFGICQKFRLKTDRTTTIDQMANLVRLALVPTLHLRQILTEKVSKVGRDTLLAMAITLPPQHPIEAIKAPEASREPLKASRIDLDQATFDPTDLTFFRRAYAPKTGQEAIILAATNFNVGILDVQDPVREYENLKTDFLDSGKLSRYVKVDPAGIIVDLETTFDPRLPVTCYNKIFQLAELDGYTGKDRDEAYTILQLNAKIETFHLQVVRCDREETPIYFRKITEVPKESLLYFGSSTTEFIPLTVDELYDQFNHWRLFISPGVSSSEPQILESYMVEKLIRILVKVNSLESKRLLHLIRQIQEDLQDVTQKVAVFEKYVEPEDRKAKAITLLTSLLHLGMAMRGWSSGPYPIGDALVPESQVGEVILTVSVRLVDFMTRLHQAGVVGSLIENLPLIRYTPDRGLRRSTGLPGPTCSGNPIQNFSPSMNRKDGLTIGERIKIVMAGEDNDDYASCIRISSNWLCTTAYYYLTLFDLTEPFRIGELREIS